jgi:hypothetical protein
MSRERWASLGSAATAEISVDQRLRLALGGDEAFPRSFPIICVVSEFFRQRRSLDSSNSVPEGQIALLL